MEYFPVFEKPQTYDRFHVFGTIFAKEIQDILRLISNLVKICEVSSEEYGAKETWTIL